VNVSQTSTPGRFEIPELGRALHVVQAYALLNLIPASRIVPKVWPAIVLFLFGISMLRAHSFWRAAGRCLWIWVALAVTALPILIGAIFEHGPTALAYAYRFGKAVPFVFFGMVVGWAPGGLRRLGPWIGLGALVTAVVGAIFDVQIQAETGLPGGRFTHSQTGGLSMLTIGWSQAAALVYLGIILVLCLVATPRRTRSRKLLVLALLAIVVAVVTASFTAATGLLGIAGVSLLVHEMVVRRKIAQAVLLGVTMLGAGYALAVSDNPYAARTTDRFVILSETAMEGESLEGVDESGRWTEAMVSWNSFMSEPAFGIGAYYTMEFTDLLGSHCSVLDWPAQYGLVGALGPFLLFGIALVSSIRMGLRGLRPITARILALFWMVYLFNSIINPTWLEPAIDFYAFFALGLTAALRYEHQQAGVLGQPRPQKGRPSTLTPSFAQTSMR
jgi:hypothetical protein